MSTAWIIAFIIGAAIIAGLSFYLGRLLLLIKQRKAAQAAAQDAEIAKRKALNETRNITLSESIYTIAWAMRDGQCDLGEGCLRVWVLLDHYVEAQQTDNTEKYQGIFKLYDKIKDMPTHQARKKYSNKEIRQMDSDREGFEREFKPLIEQDIAQLIARFKT